MARIIEAQGQVMKIAMIASAAAFASAAAHAQPLDPYALLREGYAAGDGARAASAYAPEATYAELYESAPPRMTIGRPAIGALFSDFFASAGPGLDLNFRLVDRRIADGDVVDVGVYRVRTKDGAFYGRFFTRRREAGRFEADVSAGATRAQFEDASGPVMFAGEDEALDAAYYDALTGDYFDDEGCSVRVSRSTWRLFAFDSCDLSWRGLAREAGRRWRGGETVIADDGATMYEFSSGDVAALTIGGRTLSAAPRPDVEQVRFGSGDLTLAGSLHRPVGGGKKSPAVVLIHGSGPQDRRGYASIIEMLARRFAENGVAALAFDKRGVGASEGDWASAGFDALAADVRAAQAYLAARPDVDAKRIGYAGSSQAGWVAARAIADGGAPSFVILIGAAGAATTVAEQNIYNTRVRMGCSGFSKEQIELALAQQRAFFDARADQSKAGLLAAASDAAAKDSAIRDWLFPATAVRTSAPQWYDVLDPDFEPAPIWARYPGRAYFLFGSLDDSTETALAVRRLADANASAKVAVLEGAQHLGLKAASVCDGGVEKVSTFHPEYWKTLDRWIVEAARKAS
jgi:alpha-beta hydrolase superfamily lysophospholipase